MFFAILLLTLISITPIPGLPILLYFYSKYNFFKSLLIFILSTITSTFLQHKLGNYIFKSKFKKEIFIKTFGEKIKKIETSKSNELFLLRFIIIGKIFNIASGFINLPIKKIIIVNLAISFIYHFLYYYTVNEIDIASNLLSRIGLEISIVKIISILNSVIIVYLILRLIKLISSKILEKKSKINKNLKT
tara:strand:+ start:65 stop:634 length:570 start_codon:yes stop_codon:yes gene_type:complete